MPDSDYTLDELKNRALETLDYDAVRSLLIVVQQQLNAVAFDPFDADYIVRKIVERVIESEGVDKFQLLSLLLEIPIFTYECFVVVDALCSLDDKRVVPLFRTYLGTGSSLAREDIANGVIKVKYPIVTLALQDEFELVRYVTVKRLKPDETILALRDESEKVRLAATKKLEKEENRDGLLQALADDASNVRRIAAWYMGRRQVAEAVEPLIRLVQTEDDTETLRAAVWSLGVLRDARALPYLETLCSHDNQLISDAAIDAISKFGRETVSGANHD